MERIIKTDVCGRGTYTEMVEKNITRVTNMEIMNAIKIRSQEKQLNPRQIQNKMQVIELNKLMIKLYRHMLYEKIKMNGEQCDCKNF